MNYLIIIILNIKNGINQNDAAVYTIINLYSVVHNEQADEQANERPNATPNAMTDEQADELILTKLNLLFNYIYKKENGAKIGLQEKDRESLIMYMKKLELYASNVQAYSLMPVEKVIDEKIMQWAVKEIYVSPHKIYLNQLDREKFLLKYLKSKKYIVEKKQNYRLEELIKYFIVCLHEDFEKGRNHQ